MSNQTVVFITGTGNSGSTLLTLVLGSHNSAFALGEMVRLPFAFRRARGRLPRLCHTCDGACQFWNQPARIAILRKCYGAALPGRLLRLLPHHRDSIYPHLFDWTGKDVLVDSSKSQRWIHRQVSPLREWRTARATLILLFRDGRAVVNSRHRKHPQMPIAWHAWRWKRNVEKAMALYERFPSEDRLMISYEHMATDPCGVLPRICSFLGISYEPPMLRYWEHEHHYLYGNPGTRSLIMQFRQRSPSVSTRGSDSASNYLRPRHGTFYEDIGLAIHLDVRWQTEMSEAALLCFERIAGGTNRDLIHACQQHGSAELDAADHISAS